MKSKFNFLRRPAVLALCLLPALQSCLDNKNSYDPTILLPDAIVTVKPVAGSYGPYYMQLDDETVLYPVEEAGAKAPYGDREVRAFVKYNELGLLTGEGAGVPEDVVEKTVRVVWMDSILTKKAVNTLGSEQLDREAFGQDPVEIYRNWTVVEDGYITLHFGTLWGNTGIKHHLNLVTGTNPDDPYEVVFRHDNFEDPENYEGDGIVAFRLDDLPDTQGQTVTLTLKYRSFSGPKTVKFDYKTRQD